MLPERKWRKKLRPVSFNRNGLHHKAIRQQIIIEPKKQSLFVKQ